MHLFTLVITSLFSILVSFDSLAGTQDHLFLTSPSAQILLLENAERKTMYVNTDDTPIFKVPDVETEPVSLAPVNCSVEVLDEKEGWSLISTNDGFAYVLSKNLQETEVVTRKLRSLGVFKLTHYCPHTCCGTGNGVTASGRKATVGRTIAISKKWLPLGTHVLINGHEYVVDDRGVTGRTVDILVSTHAEARKLGVKHAEIFVIEKE